MPTTVNSRQWGIPTFRVKSQCADSATNHHSEGSSWSRESHLDRYPPHHSISIPKEPISNSSSPLGVLTATEMSTQTEDGDKYRSEIEVKNTSTETEDTLISEALGHFEILKRRRVEDAENMKRAQNGTLSCCSELFFPLGTLFVLLRQAIAELSIFPTDNYVTPPEKQSFPNPTMGPINVKKTTGKGSKEQPLLLNKKSEIQPFMSTWKAVSPIEKYMRVLGQIRTFISPATSEAKRKAMGGDVNDDIPALLFFISGKLGDSLLMGSSKTDSGSQWSEHWNQLFKNCSATLLLSSPEKPVVASVTGKWLLGVCFDHFKSRIQHRLFLPLSEDLSSPSPPSLILYESLHLHSVAKEVSDELLSKCLNPSIFPLLALGAVLQLFDRCSIGDTPRQENGDQHNLLYHYWCSVTPPDEGNDDESFYECLISSSSEPLVQLEEPTPTCSFAFVGSEITDVIFSLRLLLELCSVIEQEHRGASGTHSSAGASKANSLYTVKGGFKAARRRMMNWAMSTLSSSTSNKSTLTFLDVKGLKDQPKGATSSLTTENDQPSCTYIENSDTSSTLPRVLLSSNSVFSASLLTPLEVAIIDRTLERITSLN
eukprot:Tbor_TRINITY_DN3457_c0_g1::TRINITY_DN3457_c0_g1_i1::g.3712::m.3712